MSSPPKQSTVAPTAADEQSPARTLTKTGLRWALNVGIDGATFIFKESGRI
jgi:hypothetical protein